jgi:RNA 2',3'-cyclic 3'-phosphodiesterase
VRLFFAIVPPPVALEPVRAAVARARAATPDLGWTDPDRWHLTLAFMGEVGERDLPGLRRRGERAGRRTAPFVLRLSGAGTFRRQVLWAGIGGDLPALTELADRLDPAREARYRPHLTLARVRRHDIDLSQVLGELSNLEGPEFRVERFTLVRSHLGAATRHETVSEFRLS